MSQPTAPMAPVGPKTNTLAIVSLVLAFFISLGAVITGFIALGQIKKTGEAGHGLALAGVILGFVGIAIGLIWFLVVGLAIFASIATGGGTSTYGY